MARTDPQIKLYVPAELKDRIEAAAKAGNRSMNAEIVGRLEASFSAPVPDVWAEVVRIEAEYSAAEMFLSGVKQQLTEAQAELEEAKNSGAAKRIVEARQSMIDVLTPLQETAFGEWLVLGDRLRRAKYQAMGIKPRGSPKDAVARRLFGPEWDNMPLPPPMSPPSVAPEPAPGAEPAAPLRVRLRRPKTP